MFFRLYALAFSIDMYGVRISNFQLVEMRERLAVDASFARIA